jgi:DNA repair exonuclease SbcCD ATPase subunit|tara:strand:+ start:4742 stop:6469 length:1728 start_codon:yes stop_codon:yes gene_type:complete
MLTFESISYKNFLSTGDTPTVIPLNTDSATLVVGANGAGKSTMLDAISYALFGKPHRNINRPQLVNSINNKKLLVEVKFSLGSNNYRVVRGMKPNIFEIYHNDTLLNQESHSRDYQKVLETNILKLNHKSFHQVVVLGSSNFVPFMQLPSYQRRNVIEDLLDIGIFTKMNTLIKDRYSKMKSDIIDTDQQLSIIKEQIVLQSRHIANLKNIDIQQSTKALKQIESMQSEVDLLQNRNNDLQSKHDKIAPSRLADKNSAIENQNSLVGYKIQINTNVSKIVKDAMFYENNDCCPTCDQLITAEVKGVKKAEAQEKAQSLNHGLQLLEEKIAAANKVFDSTNEAYNAINDLLSDIRSNQSLIGNLHKQISDLQTQENAENELTDTKAAELDLDSRKVQYENALSNKSSQLETRSYYDAIGEMLKDTGIKTKIIRQYLPVMNKLINKYLNILDFFVKFDLDESFNETIKSRHRDEFSYASFSEGEKSRIDLALLFAWRQIAKMKNSANTNLLILDETFDSSLDVDGVDNLLKILYSLKKDTNVFIISHKKDVLDGKFPSRIEFEKVNNFSRIRKNGSI